MKVADLMTTSNIETMEKTRLVPWFLIASYAYYRLDVNVMSDYDFDFLVRRLRDNWNTIDHPHKSLIRDTNLEAGSGYDIDFPSIVRGATVDYLRKAGLQ